MGTLNWKRVDSEGSLFSRGKHDYYTIVIRGIPEERPKDCIIELYLTTKELTIAEIKYKPRNGQIKLLSRSVLLGDLSSNDSIENAIEEMKDAAERRENKNPYSSLTSAYTLK